MKHPWVMGIEVCTNEGPCSFPRGDNSEIVNDPYIDSFLFPESLGKFQPNLGQSFLG